MIDSRNINDLHPILKVITEQFLEIAAEKGLRIGISNTLRDVDMQNALYAKGRTAPSSIVTNVKGGFSYHNWGLAVDIVPLDQNGNLSWPEVSPVWAQLGEIGESLGLDWGGRWDWDRPHYEMSLGYACSDFTKGVKVPQTIKKGCKDASLVKFMQRLLGVNPDGIIGAETEKAILKFNKTGEVDAQTLKELMHKTETKPISGNSTQVSSEIRYNAVWELPVWAQPTIQKLIDKGYISGNETGLDLSVDMVRQFIVNDRAGQYDLR